MPVNVIAWIIAIEKYSGPELNIKQPVGLWALDFAELMLSRGVGNIVLSTSLNDISSYSPRLLELEMKGVTRTGADVSDIQDALEKVRGAGSLFIYWVGHGIMAPSRHLLCADSKKASDLRVINSDSLLTRLRAPEYPRLQIGFFECCAQIVTTVPATLSLGGEGRTPTRQFFYHAASAGEIATGSLERAGFSSQVLKALRDSQTFPPDAPEHFFETLKTYLATIPLQTRPFLQRTEESGDIWSSGDPGKKEDMFDAARVAELSESQFECLWRSIRTAGISPIELARAHHDNTLPALIKTLRDSQPLLAAPDLLEKAARFLRLQRDFEPLCLRLRLLFDEWLALYRRVSREDLMGDPERKEDLPRLLLSTLDQRREEFGIRSFTKLLELAARQARKQEPRASEELRKTLAKHPMVEKSYACLLEEMPVVNDYLFLLLAIDWEPSTRTASLIDAWIYPGINGGFDTRELPTRKCLAEQISATIQRAIQEFPERPLRIELLSPKELLCVPRDLLELLDPDLGTCTWLEAEHPITFRWHDRMKGDERFFPGTWKAASFALRDEIGRATSLSCEWRPRADDERGDGHFVGLTFPGPCPSDSGRNRAQFFGEILKGKPYMCWPRNESHDLGSFKAAVGRLLANSKLTNLPIKLRNERSELAITNLVVLIDEADRNPYNDLDNFTETGQRGK